MKRLRPTTTLFMLMSVDGKISTGDSDTLDVDRDYPTVPGVREGLHQYYDLQKQTDYVSFNTGRTMTKIGVNTRPYPQQPIDCQFVIIDNQPHLTARGITYLTRWVAHLYLVTTDPQHPAFASTATNLTVILEPQLDLPALFARLWTEFKIKRITIQSGGTMNASLIRAGLIDHLTLVVAPVLVGGANTNTLMDGASLHTVKDLHLLRPLKLVEARPLKDSYLLLRYNV